MQLCREILAWSSAATPLSSAHASNVLLTNTLLLHPCSTSGEPHLFCVTAAPAQKHRNEVSRLHGNGATDARCLVVQLAAAVLQLIQHKQPASAASFHLAWSSDDSQTREGLRSGPKTAASRAETPLPRLAEALGTVLQLVSPNMQAALIVRPAVAGGAANALVLQTAHTAADS